MHVTFCVLAWSFVGGVYMHACLLSDTSRAVYGKVVRCPVKRVEVVYFTMV